MRLKMMLRADCSSLTIFLLCLLNVVHIRDSLAQEVKVQPEVVSREGQVVTLTCQFLNPGGIMVTQVYWIFETASGIRNNIATFHPAFGVVYPTSPVKGRVSFTVDPLQLESPAIQITDIKKTDEGRYICEYATYPSGTMQGVTNLIIIDSQAQQVKVQPEVVSHEGQVVTLPCQFLHPDQTKLTQVSWIFETASGIMKNIATFHSVFGIVYPTSPVKGRVSFTVDPPQLESPAIQITDIKKTDEGRYICEYALYPSGNVQGFTNLSIIGSQAQRVKVQPEVVSYEGQDITLPCQFLDPGQTKLTQVSWIYETAAGAQNNIATFHSVFGIVYPTSPVKGRVSFTVDPPQLESPAIQITDIKKTDEGRYICEYALYPSGNVQGVTNLSIIGSQAQRVKVQPEVVSYEGQDITLPCQFLDPGQTKLTQVSWIYETAAGARNNIATFHSVFGIVYPTSPVKGRVSFTVDPPQLESPAIQITDIKKTDEGRYICEYALYPCGIEQGVTNLIILGPLAQQVKVQPEVVSYPGKVVTLRCLFPDPGQIVLTQVSWIYETAAGARSNIAVFHPVFGFNYPMSPVKDRVSFTTFPPQLESPSIQITDIKKTDEGRYICEYAIYPSGNVQGVTNLIILAQCEKPSVGENRVLTPESVKQSYSDGDTATFQCSVGYQPVDPQASKSITCSGNKWTELALQCKRAPCPDPPQMNEEPVEPIKEE